MKKTIQIGDKSVEFMSNGATPIFYTIIMGEDYLKAFNNWSNDKMNQSEALMFMYKVAYVMYVQAKSSNPAKHSKAAFYKWLSQFENMDLMLALEEIAGVYTGEENLGELVTAKNPDGPQIEN